MLVPELSWSNFDQDSPRNSSINKSKASFKKHNNPK